MSCEADLNAAYFRQTIDNVLFAPLPGHLHQRCPFLVFHVDVFVAVQCQHLHPFQLLALECHPEDVLIDEQQAGPQQDDSVTDDVRHDQIPDRVPVLVPDRQTGTAIQQLVEEFFVILPDVMHEVGRILQDRAVRI